MTNLKTNYYLNPSSVHPNGIPSLSVFLLKGNMQQDQSAKENKD
jgi:hypothetical protein